GYRALKLDPFGTAWQELSAGELRRAIALVEAVREGAGPDAEVFVEMHGRFTPAQAIAIARELEPYRPGWIEEPVPPDNAKAMAAIHLAAATPNFKILEHFNDFTAPFVKEAARGVPDVVDGAFPLPTAPGLGITLDEAVIAAHPRRPVHLNLFGDQWHLRGRE